MTKHTKYLILISFTLILGNCGVSQKNLQKLEYEKIKTELIRIATEDFLNDNNEFFEFQNKYRLEKINVRKAMGLNSSMFDWGMPMKTIDIQLKKKHLPSNYQSIKYRLCSDKKIDRKEKNLGSFQYIYLDDLYFDKINATLNIRLFKIVNGQTKQNEVEYKFVKEINNWKITSAKKNGVEQRI